jgi:hypothetical protein
MTFEFKKVSNYGTKNPVVARLRLQTHELLQWADLTSEQRIEVFEIYGGMADRLLKCHETYDRIVAAREKSLADLGSTSEARARTAPFVIGLTGEVETILYESKNFLRDLLGVPRVFFGTSFDEASAFHNPKGGDGKLVEWATRTFGQNDPYAKMLAYEQAWLGELIQRRNAVEHPGQKSGTLQVHNFRTLPDGRYLEPCWHRDEELPSNILSDLKVILSNLLGLAEDVLAASIMHKTDWNGIRFYVIPEKDRRQECPTRLKVALNEAALMTRKSR